MSNRKTSSTSEPSGQHWKNRSLTAPRRVDLWLNTVGYPLEFHTQAAFAGNGFETQQGLHIPLDEGNPSDLDVLASLSSSDGQTRFEVVTECKVVPEPMLVAGFREQQLPLDGPSDGMVRTSAAHRLEDSRDTAQALHQFRREFAWQGTPTFSLKTVKDDGGKDVVYEALVQVARSALGRVEQFEYEPTAILVPLVVLDAPLVTVGWDSTSRQFRSTEVAHLELRGRGAPGWPHPTMTVHVTTKKGLDQTVKYLWGMGTSWLAMVDALRSA